MAAYEDANGALRAMAYPDNHQGYGRMQLDQVGLSFTPCFLLLLESVTQIYFSLPLSAFRCRSSILRVSTLSSPMAHKIPVIRVSVDFPNKAIPMNISCV